LFVGSGAIGLIRPAGAVLWCGYEAGINLVKNLKLLSDLANVGDRRSPVVIHPASTTHRQLSDERKWIAGASPDVVRLSIGIEHKA
jgi:O-acetylhomoserine (thiol)-lyase